MDCRCTGNKGPHLMYCVPRNHCRFPSASGGTRGDYKLQEVNGQILAENQARRTAIASASRSFSLRERKSEGSRAVDGGWNSPKLVQRHKERRVQRGQHNGSNRYADTETTNPNGVQHCTENQISNPGKRQCSTKALAEHHRVVAGPTHE